MVPQSSAAEPQAFAGLAGWAAVSFAALSGLDAPKAAGDTGDLGGSGRGWGCQAATLGSCSRQRS